jgi:RNA polymerase sigma-70 factor, ECF subfamily
MVDVLSAGHRWPAGEGDAPQEAVRLVLARVGRDASQVTRAAAGASAEVAGVEGAPAPRESERPLRESVEPGPPSRVRVISRAAAAREAEPDDAALVEAALRGDRQAHGAIWSRYVSLVRSKLGRSLGAQDVEDQVQEVFLRLFEYLSQLRDPTALRSFIIGITLRTAGTELRRRRCRWWLNLTMTGDLPEPGGPDDSETREVVARLLELVGKLNEQSSRVFELRYLEEKELTEVADAMSISLATAKRYLARAAARVFAMAEREPSLAVYVRRAAAGTV